MERKDNLDLSLQRRRAGVTQTEIADRLECSVPAVSKFENGQTSHLPRALTREDYERALQDCIRLRLSGATA